VKPYTVVPLVLPLVALILQAIAIGLLFVVADAAYGLHRGIAFELERLLTWILLALAGIVAGGITVAGLYRLYLRCRLRVAFPLTVVYLPPLAVASVATYMLLIFLRLV